MNTIQAEWEFFKKKVITDHVPVEQMHDMKNLFYSGALSTLAILMDISHENMSIDAGAQVIENLRKEIIEFLDINMKE